MEKQHYNVVAAVVKKDDRYLCMQRCRSEKDYNTERWEFPGGVVEAGESDHEALVREIKEELDWDIYVGRPLATVEHEYPDVTITLRAYLCLAADEDFKLLEHLDFKWLPREELLTLRWTAADEALVRQALA